MANGAEAAFTRSERPAALGADEWDDFRLHGPPCGSSATAGQRHLLPVHPPPCAWRSARHPDVHRPAELGVRPLPPLVLQACSRWTRWACGMSHVARAGSVLGRPRRRKSVAADTSLIPRARNHPALGDGSKGYSTIRIRGLTCGVGRRWRLKRCRRCRTSFYSPSSLPPVERVLIPFAPVAIPLRYVSVALTCRGRRAYRPRRFGRVPHVVVHAQDGSLP